MRGRRTARIARGGQTMPALRREKPKPAHAILLRVLISSEFLRNRTYSLAENTCLEYVHVKFASTNFIFVETPHRSVIVKLHQFLFYFNLCPTNIAQYPRFTIFDFGISSSSASKRIKIRAGKLGCPTRKTGGAWIESHEKSPRRESWASHAQRNFLYLNGRADIIANGRRKQRLRNVMQSLSVPREGTEGGRMLSLTRSKSRSLGRNQFSMIRLSVRSPALEIWLFLLVSLEKLNVR